MIRLLFHCRTVALASCLLLYATTLPAQTKPIQKTYTFLIYHKLAPGLTIQDALPVEREWRKINQAAVDEGKLEGWYMSVKQYTTNPNQAEYDYVTRIVSREMAIKGASPEAMARLYGDSVKVKMADLQKRDRATAPVVKMEIWETNDGTFSPTFALDGSQFLVIDRIQRRNPAADYEPLVSQMKQFSEDRIKQNNLQGWDFSSLLIPNGSEKGYELASTQYVTSLYDATHPIAAVNPTMSAQASKKLRSQMAQTFDVVRQEVYRLMEFTTKPAK